MRTNSWRAAVVMAVLVLVVGTGACGSSGGGKATGAAAGKDAAGRPKLPVGGTNAGADRSSKELAAPVAGAGAASLVAPVRFLEYRLADGAKAPATEAAAYKVVPGDTKESVAAVARALDVDKDKVEVQQGLGWYYSASTTGSVSSGVAVACSSDETCPEPVRPPPPPGVPTAAEAETRFRKMLDALGADTANGSFEVQPDQVDLRQVTFHQKVKGIEVEGFESSIAFGGNGRIEYANGFLGTFDKVGTYPLVDLAAALKRQNQGFGGGIRPLGAAEERSPDPAATNVAPASSPGANGQTGGDSAVGRGGADVPPPAPDEPTVTIEPQPTTPTEPLEPEVVEVTGADLVLQVVYGMCPGDPAFLLPAFRFLPRERAGFSIPAVEDASLAQARPVDADAKGAAPCPGQPERGVPVGKPTDPGVPVGKPEPVPAPPPPDAGRGAPAPKP